MVRLSPQGMNRKSQDYQSLTVDCLSMGIARLSDVEVGQLSREELVDVVSRTVLDQLPSSSRAHLEFINEAELKRLACLARFACRRKLNLAFSQYGRQVPFLECV